MDGPELLPEFDVGWPYDSDAPILSPVSTSRGLTDLMQNSDSRVEASRPGPMPPTQCAYYLDYQLSALGLGPGGVSSIFVREASKHYQPINLERKRRCVPPLHTTSLAA